LRNAHVAGEPRHRDVLDTLGPEDLVQSSSAETAGLDAGRQKQIAISGSRLQRLIIRGFLGADLPGTAADLPAVKAAGIRRIELAIVRRVALGDMNDQNAFGPGLADQLDRAFKHPGLRECWANFWYQAPSARRNSPEVDQKDGSLFRLDAFRRWHHRLGLRRRKQSKHRDDRHRDLKPNSPDSIFSF
jgi:hypothetical protein